jgi:vacuolar-type H+-ATPase subunit H
VYIRSITEGAFARMRLPVQRNLERAMAGELIRKIKETETEAAQILSEVKDRAMKMILGAEEKKAVYIEEKDELLKADEIKIREKYDSEKQDMIREIENEEKNEIEGINRLCEANISKVVTFISEEIVKE